MMYEAREILQSSITDTKNVHNMYQYGSHVYECNDELSDIDVIVIGGFCPCIDHNNDKIDFTFIKELDFVYKLLDHEISALECLYLPDKYIIQENISFKERVLPKVSLSKLRHSISAKASNSFVKCKKKLTVEKDYNPRIGKKSLFHSLRIILFGIQLAKIGRIEDYTVANQYWYDIVNNPSDDWEYYKKIYKPEYNRLMTEFRKLAPK